MNEIDQLKKALQACKSRVRMYKARLYDAIHHSDEEPKEVELKARIIDLEEHLQRVIYQKEEFKKIRK